MTSEQEAAVREAVAVACKEVGIEGLRAAFGGRNMPDAAMPADDTLTQLRTLEAAKAYIKDLEEHEGAEGFSTSTAILGAKYRELLNKKE